MAQVFGMTVEELLRFQNPHVEMEKTLAVDEMGRLFGKRSADAAQAYLDGTCLSVPEIAKAFGVPDCIVNLKYEAMAVPKYKVPSMELPTFDKVFGGW